MLTVSQEHFERMQMMCQFFERESKKLPISLPEFEASKAINNLIESIETPDIMDFKNIVNILNDVDNVEHTDGSHWFDYKIHVWATL